MPKRVKVSVDDDVNDQPCIYGLRFTNGYLDENCDEHLRSSKTFKHIQNKKTTKLVVAIDEMEYAGNYDGSKKGDGRYVGIEDPDTGTMTIVPLKRVKLRSAVCLPSQGADGENEAPVKKRGEQYDSLAEFFGTMKAKQTVIRKHKHGINPEMIHDAIDSSNIKDIKVDEKHESPEAEADEESVIPPHNVETSDVDQAYPLDGLFPEYLRTSLADMVSDFTDVTPDTLATWKAEEKLPHFVLSQLGRLPLDRNMRAKSACILKFIAALIKVYRLKPQGFKSKDPLNAASEGLDKLSDACNKYILANFTNKTGRSRGQSMRQKDKTAIIVLLLALKLEDYRLHAKDLLMDLQLSTKKYITLARAVGCKVSHVKGKGDEPVIITELKAPLKIPEVKPMKLRRQ